MSFEPEHPEKYQTGEWLRAEGPDSDIAICTRVRLARNVQGYSFSTCMGDVESQELVWRGSGEGRVSTTTPGWDSRRRPSGTSG